MNLKPYISAVIATAGLCLSLSANAQDWQPDGPITLQIGFDAGGETDTIGRAIAASMEESTGWDVIAENKPGGGGIAMFTGLSAAAPDGRTLGMGVSMPVLINLVLRGDKLPFTLESFDYLATVARAQLAIVARADAPYDDIEGLVAAARDSNIVVAFDAKPQELLVKTINKMSNVDLKLLSTKSSAEGVQNLLGGHVAASFAAGVHTQYLQSGDLKMLASANATRHSYAPDTPTLIEQGWDIYTDPYFYIAAPAGLPDAARDALASALNMAIASEGVSTVIVNALRTEASNLGAEGTEKMLTDGLDVVRLLLSND
jgi:tripartite-type tricarboxylate transporter receptor subunit TctC